MLCEVVKENRCTNEAIDKKINILILNDIFQKHVCFHLLKIQKMISKIIVNKCSNFLHYRHDQRLRLVTQQCIQDSFLSSQLVFVRSNKQIETSSRFDSKDSHNSNFEAVHDQSFQCIKISIV